MPPPRQPRSASSPAGSEPGAGFPLEAESSLDRFPRLALGHLPTPLEPLPRLSAELGGPPIWVKRDDCTGLGLGGNKVRKLEYLLGEAREQGVTTVLTLGGVQSNHARQTAAAAARLGLRCELVLPRVVARQGTDYDANGNVLLDRLFGAQLFVVEDEPAAARTLQERLAAAEQRGERAVVHPPGGSTPVGALGYVRAALELAAQARAAGLCFQRIYVAVGTGGTLAGLLRGFQLAQSETGQPFQVRGVCVAHEAAVDRPAVGALADSIGELLGLPPLPDSAVDLDGGFLGEGYGVPSEAALHAIARCARSEGLLLDPVYTGKAMAALLADLEGDGLRAGPLLFWHTGGAPALFAYREELALGSGP